MTAPGRMKLRVKAELGRPTVSKLVTRSLRPLGSRLPRAVTARLPVVGTFHARTQAGTDFALAGVAGDTIASAIFWRGWAGWEPETTAVLEALAVAAGRGCFLDVGANTGVLTVMAGCANPDLTVHAFEPVPAVFDALVANVAVNASLAPRARAHPCALSDANGMITLHVPRDRLPVEATLVAGLRMNTSAIEVPVTTLDTFLDDEGIPSVDILKIDAEGAEHLVLAGGARLIERHRPTIICEVLRGQPSESALRDFARREQYRPYHLTRSGPVFAPEISGDPTYVDLNFLLVHRDRLATLPPGLLSS